jgi:DNA-binding XRE family transcriptional regulator
MVISPKQARVLCDLSQKEVAYKLGVHRQTYMKWERNPDEIPVGKAKEFSEIVGRGVDEIFFVPESTLSGH